MAQPKVKVATVQASPVYYDIDKTVEKGVALIEEAARNGAKLIAFPELWIPGYPFFFWLNPPIAALPYMPSYRENSFVVGGPHDMILRAAAVENDIYVCMGYSELSGSSLYMGQMLISPEGAPLIVRRKLKPTLAERCTFGEGDGSHLQVVDTEIGRIGALNCWEHLQPLSKYAMYSQSEQIHIASWPCMALYKDIAYGLSATMTLVASQLYAAEGQCYVLCATQPSTPEVIEALCKTDEQRALLKLGGGCSQIFGPDGCPQCTPIPEDQEGILYADVDFGLIGMAKTAGDPAGHYSRPDVTRLLLNTAPARPVVNMDEFMQAPIEEVECDECCDCEGEEIR